MRTPTGELRKRFYVYILASRMRGVLYVGVTSTLERRKTHMGASRRAIGRLHQAVLRPPLGLVRGASGRAICHPKRKAAQTLAAQLEDRPRRARKSGLDRPLRRRSAQLTHHPSSRTLSTARRSGILLLAPERSTRSRIALRLRRHASGITGEGRSVGRAASGGMTDGRLFWSLRVTPRRNSRR
jgi:hypothetical protein